MDPLITAHFLALSKIYEVCFSEEAANPTFATVIYISPQCNDNWTGALDLPNPLDSTVLFTSQDAGTASVPIVYQAATGVYGEGAWIQLARGKESDAEYVPASIRGLVF